MLLSIESWGFNLFNRQFSRTLPSNCGVAQFQLIRSQFIDRSLAITCRARRQVSVRLVGKPMPIRKVKGSLITPDHLEHHGIT